MSLIPPPPPSEYGNLIGLMASLYSRRFTLISFHFPAELSELEAQHHIQPVINMADDWLKYAGNCWIVWSAKTPTEWHAQFQTIERLKNCTIFIINLDISPGNRAGQAPMWVWDWIGKRRI